MFTFAHQRSAFAACALAVAMACSFASPASSFSLSGSEAPGNYTPRPMAPRPFDGGGNIFSYLSNARAANYSARRTVIAGVCASACTMKLSIRNACIEPDATLLFHQASYNGSRSELATRVMLFAYPRKIRDWVLRSGALNSTARSPNGPPKPFPCLPRSDCRRGSTLPRWTGRLSIRQIA